MKRVVVPRYGGPEVLSVVEEDEPIPGPGQVRVRVLAAGVSFTDTLLRAGTYPGGPKPPFTPGYEFAGVVEQMGSGCSTLVPGDRVAALVVWGGYAEMVCVTESLAIKVPDDVDPAVLVSVIFPYMTAYQLIHRAAKAQPGETVLYHGAAGRVGVACSSSPSLQAATSMGLPSTADCALVERLGGVAIDYTRKISAKRARSCLAAGSTSRSTASADRCRFVLSERCGAAVGWCSLATTRPLPWDAAVGAGRLSFTPGRALPRLAGFSRLRGT